MERHEPLSQTGQRTPRSFVIDNKEYVNVPGVCDTCAFAHREEPSCPRVAGPRSVLLCLDIGRFIPIAAYAAARLNGVPLHAAPPNT
jgi:hypothetical protein